MRKDDDKMKKRNRSIIITLILLIVLMVSVSGCGRVKLSGTYVNEHDREEKFKFSGESKVTYYNKNESMDGSYQGSGKSIIAVFGQGDDTTMEFLTIENKKVLYYNSMAFVKKGFIERYWHIALIIGVAYCIITAIYKKKTGRDLEEDLENLSDKL